MQCSGLHQPLTKICAVFVDKRSALFISFVHSPCGLVQSCYFTEDSCLLWLLCQASRKLLKTITISLQSLYFNAHAAPVCAQTYDVNEWMDEVYFSHLQQTKKINSKRQTP